MKNLAIIPARGGSKRIPRKNVKPFLGKPMLAYSIEAALASGLFDEVMVSTDDEEIAEVARQYGAKVPFMRSEATSNDYAGLNEVIVEVDRTYISLGEKYDNICCILSTAPLIQAEDIVNAFNKLKESDFECVYPVVEFSYPILRSLSLDDDNNLVMNWPEYSNTRSQDLKPAYHDAGSFYWIDAKAYRRDYSFDNLKTTGSIMDGLKVQDIDTETDWKFAELKFKFLNNIQ